MLAILMNIDGEIMMRTFPNADLMYSIDSADNFM